MNAHIGKYATWVVRVLSPKLVQYQFKAKSEVVNATKLQCILVSKDPKHFLIGTVPFSFAARDAPRQAFDKFEEGLTFQIRTPALTRN